MISRVPFMAPKEILIRWINHILRSYNQLRNIFNLQETYKNKFKESKMLAQAANKVESAEARTPRLTISA